MAIENIEEIREKILNELSKYPKEKVGNLIEQIENATDEEIEEFVLNQQKMQQNKNIQSTDECIFCNIILGKTDTIKIYEDNEIMAILDIMPATMGHILVFPKQHKHFIQEIEDDILSKIFLFIKKISPKIIQILKADGISIYIPQGQIAGQRIPHFVVNIIPRYSEDKISFDWQREKKEKKDLEKIAESLKKEIDKIKIFQEEKIQKEFQEKESKGKSPKEKIIKLKRKIPR